MNFTQLALNSSGTLLDQLAAQQQRAAVFGLATADYLESEPEQRGTLDGEWCSANKDGDHDTNIAGHQRRESATTLHDNPFDPTRAPTDFLPRHWGE